jgi:hypothetical protein
LTEYLTERDKAAPDLGCALTLQQPRTDRPEVTPLAMETPSPPYVNDLHRLVAEILEKFTGMPQPDQEAIFDYIHDAYQALMDRHKDSATSSGAASGH